MKNKRSFIAFIAACLIGSAVYSVNASAAYDKTAATEAILAKILIYLNNLKTVTARFMQVGPNGSVRTGSAIVQRPGKMRFQYDKPNPQLLIAGFGLVVYHDPELDQTSNIPLSSTPLGILLTKHITFSGPVTVAKMSTPPGEIQVTLIRSGKAEQGHITLVFSTDPIELKQWRITDAQGRITQVSLYDLKPSKPFPDKEFEYIPGLSKQ